MSEAQVWRKRCGVIGLVSAQPARFAKSASARQQEAFRFPEEGGGSLSTQLANAHYQP